jgi:hypothetical protein
LSHYDGVDSQRKPIAVITLHKCGIGRSHIFELLKPLNIMHVFVYCTVKLFFYMGGVSDRKRSDRPHMVHTPQVNNAVKSRINRNPV